jgi:hypothetical protein
MNSICTWLNTRNLKSILHRSFEEFNVTDQAVQKSIYQKYSVDLDKNKLLSLELFERGNLVASALSSYQQFYANCGPLKLSFLTQIIVQREYRGLGYLRKIMEIAQEVDERNQSLASIVIARRRVGNLYSRYGYLGFGVFPQIVFETSRVQELQINSLSVDWGKITNAYEKTYRDIPGSVLRSKAYWRYVRNEVENGIYSLGTFQSGKDFGYVLYSKGICLEIASTNGALFPELLRVSLDHGIVNFKIGSNHPFFGLAISEGGVYTVRPEREEGHMLKPYLGGEFLRKEIDLHMERIFGSKCNAEKYSIDINLLNEW